MENGKKLLYLLYDWFISVMIQVWKMYLLTSKFIFWIFHDSCKIHVNWFVFSDQDIYYVQDLQAVQRHILTLGSRLEFSHL